MLSIVKIRPFIPMAIIHVMQDEGCSTATVTLAIVQYGNSQIPSSTNIYSMTLLLYFASDSLPTRARINVVQ
jgi:hypothetical protein